jgi:hypothetical protein
MREEVPKPPENSEILNNKEQLDKRRFFLNSQSLSFIRAEKNLQNTYLLGDSPLVTKLPYCHSLFGLLTRNYCS